MKIGAALQDPDCLAGFKKLNWIIAGEYPFNDFLCHLIQRELCHRTNPKTAAIEEEAIHPFVEGIATLPQVIEDLKVRLANGR